jgi:quercetin dioxygenase-like cupin family protein
MATRPQATATVRIDDGRVRATEWAFAPGAETGWHTHGVPLVGLILDGELTVDYGDKGQRTYKAGQSLAEAINIPHSGKNTGSGVMRLFAIYMG